MRSPAPLPDPLGDGPFDRAALARHGGHAERVRRRDVLHPFHGVMTTSPATDLIGRCREYSVRLRAGEVFSHGTAARLHCVWLPKRSTTTAAST